MIMYSSMTLRTLHRVTVHTMTRKLCSAPWMTETAGTLLSVIHHTKILGGVSIHRIRDHGKIFNGKVETGTICLRYAMFRQQALCTSLGMAITHSRRYSYPREPPNNGKWSTSCLIELLELHKAVNETRRAYWRWTRTAICSVKSVKIERFRQIRKHGQFFIYLASGVAVTPVCMKAAPPL